jgi:hypothetical protein
MFKWTGIDWSLHSDHKGVEQIWKSMHIIYMTKKDLQGLTDTCLHMDYC